MGVTFSGLNLAYTIPQAVKQEPRTYRPLGSVKFTPEGSTSKGIKTNIHLSAAELSLVKRHFNKITGPTGQAMIFSKEDKSYMQVYKAKDGGMWLIVSDPKNKYECTARIDRAKGQLTLLRGAQYEKCSSNKCNAERTANMLKGYIKDHIYRSVKVKKPTLHPIIDPANRNDPDAAAKQLWKYLSKFPFRDNGHHSMPEEVEARGDIDCDDYAIYAWTELKKAGIEAKVVVIEKPEDQRNDGGIDHVVCVYKKNDQWAWIDFKDVMVVKDRNWWRLPALMFKKPVKYMEVDMNKWVNGLLDNNLNKSDSWPTSK